MDDIVPFLSKKDKRRFKRFVRTTHDHKLATRYLIVLNLADERSPGDTALALHVSRSTVYRVAERFCEYGEPGLLDRRQQNGNAKLDEDYLGALHEAVQSYPDQYGWPRPTWTRELLVETMAQQIGVRIHVSTMSHALRAINARRGRPKPVVDCPWSTRAKNRRLCELEQLRATLPDDEVLVYEDEVDIHLNPKIGLDWMVSGQQKEVMTPGRNEKRYLAGALDDRSGEEQRSYYICPVPDDLPDRDRWPKLKAIGIAISETIRDGKTCSEVRYYILSKFLSGRKFAEAVREHWSIENRLHWQLDVTFGEDQCRIRQGHADANFSILRRTVLSMLKNETTAKVGVKNKRLRCGWDDTYLEKVLTGS